MKTNKTIWIIGIIILVAIIYGQYIITGFEKDKYNTMLMDNSTDVYLVDPNPVNPFFVVCTAKTCSQLAQYCGSWSNGCGKNINCGTCPSVSNHINIVGCDTNTCDCNSLKSGASVTKVKEDYNKIINYFGGESYLSKINYAFPNVNINYVCNIYKQRYLGFPEERIDIDPYDTYGPAHETVHWTLRHYSNPSIDFFNAFEEGFTTRVSYCALNENDPCCNIDNGQCTITDNQICIPSSSVCYYSPGVMARNNYEFTEAGMLEMMHNKLNCDYAHCWKWFFQNIVANKKGKELTFNDAYNFLLGYTKNKTAVDSILNIYQWGPVDWPQAFVSPNATIVPASAYPSSVKIPACTPSWVCSNWTTCSSSKQNRVCYDLYHCGTGTLGKPIESQSCCSKLKTCAQLGAKCGIADAGCGKMINCGTCSSGKVCSNGQCVCVPKTCSQLGKKCGSANDGCGKAINCGTCAKGTSCKSGVCK